MAQRKGRTAAATRGSRLASDERLVARVREGDRAAFEALYDRYARELLSYCTYMLGSRDDAEDAVQATFASAYTALLDDERGIEVRPWLFSIARNASLTIVRKRRAGVGILDRVAREELAAQVERRESVRELFDAVLALPERQRTALVLAELHGHSHREIGTVLGASAEQVKAYVYQARSSLVSELNARSADCEEIRRELATARGADLLRSRLRRHLRSCADCRAFAREHSRRRRSLGAALPLGPSLALKRRVLHATVGNGGGGTCAGGAAAGGGSLAGGSSAAGGSTLAGATVELGGVGVKALALKALVVAAVAGAGTTAGALTIATASPSAPGPAPGSSRAVVTRATAYAAAVGERAPPTPSGALAVHATQATAANVTATSPVAPRGASSIDVYSTRARDATAGGESAVGERTAASGGGSPRHGATGNGNGKGNGKEDGNGNGKGNGNGAGGSQGKGNAGGNGGGPGSHGNGNGHGAAGSHGQSGSHGQAGVHGNSGSHGGPASPGAAGSPGVAASGAGESAHAGNEAGPPASPGDAHGQGNGRTGAPGHEAPGPGDTGSAHESQGAGHASGGQPETHGNGNARH